MLEELKQDFLPYGENLELETLDWNAMIEYINKCVDLCSKQVELVVDGKEPDNPIKYMIPINFK